MIHLTCVLSLAVLLVASLDARAQLVIEITKGVQDAVPIAVVPFGWAEDSPAPFDVAEIVAGDLHRSGQFAPLPRDTMLEKPTTGGEIDFQDWRLLGTEVVVIGRVVREGPDAYEVQFQVFDVFRGEQLLGYAIPSPGGLLRATAHRVSDMVYETLTGVPGAFSTRIAYITVERNVADPQHGRRTDRFRLIVADADGENPQIMAESSAPLMSPAWSPEGHRIAYVSFEGDASAIYVQELATGDRRRVSARNGVNSAPAWSPDGHRLALTLSEGSANLDIYVLNLGTNELKRVTRNASIDTEPAWSRDGRNLYFTSDRSGGPQVYQVDTFGGRPGRVTFEGSYNARPRLSPDESLLALVHNDGGNYRIAVMDLRGRGLQVLTKGELDESPSFAPNGSMIIYATQVGGKGVLAAVSVDGSVQQRLASRGGEIREPVWSPLPPPR